MNQNKNTELKNYLKGHHFEFGAKASQSVKNSQKIYEGSADQGRSKAEKDN